MEGRHQLYVPGMQEEEEAVVIRYAHCLVTRKSPMTWVDTQE